MAGYGVVGGGLLAMLLSPAVVVTNPGIGATRLAVACGLWAVVFAGYGALLGQLLAGQAWGR